MFETTESFRLSPLQRHLCALQQTEEPFPYHTHCAVWLEGRLDLSRLRRALKLLVGRYEILRTKFPRLPGLTWPVQAIDGDMHLPLVMHDYGSISSISRGDVPLWSGTEVSPSGGPDRGCRDSALCLSGPPQGYASMGMRQEGPLWQVTLITCNSDCHWLLWDLSALIADAQTCHILLRELSQLYMGIEVGEEELQETLQYADLAEWQYEWLESAEAAPGRDYWRFLERVELVPTRLSTLSADMSPFITRSLAINLAPVTLTQLKALAQRLEVAPSAVLLACWGIVLSCLRGEVDLLIGVRASGRNDEALTEAVGLLAKYLPLHGQFLASTSFSEVVRHLEATVHEAHKWQEYFSWQLFDPYRQQGQEPFCPFNFDYETLPPPWSTGSDHEKLQWSVEEQEQCLDRFSVSLSCVENAQGMLVRLSYDQACFAQEEMQSLLTRWQTVLQQVLTSSDVPLGTLQLLTHEEQHWLLHSCNATSGLAAGAQTNYPKDKCLHQLFAEQVGHVSDTIALICGDEQVSYQELNKRANQLAHYLRRQGVGPEVRVGLCLERSVALLIGLLGILKADGVYVPLDPAYPQERLAFIQRDASISLLLTQEHLLGRLPDTYENILCLERDWGLIANENETAPEHRGTVEQLAYILYTSGSTGQPKGVMVPHRGLVNYLHWAARAYATPESYGAPLHSPIGFDLTVTSVFVPLLTGQRIVLLPEEQGVAALATILGSKSRFNLVKVTPSHLEVLSRSVSAAELAEEAQVMIIGGEALWYESLSLWRERAPQTRLVNEYGPTETVVGCCVYEVPEDAPASGAVPIGRPIANMQMYVLNDYLQPVLVGVSGELYIGGVGVTRGYLNRPELTAERFVPHPWSQEPGARLYRTGDLARYLPSGDLEYVGRVDQQVKIHGFRIEPGEIETQLRLYSGVQECIVVAREDQPGEKRLVAYAVAREASSSPSYSELRRFLLDKLPDYMVPTAFVLLPELPRTPNGKVDRRMLPLPDRTRPDLAEALVLPRTPTEEILAGIWSTVLGREQVGIYDNFFALGGDSIRSIQALSLAQERGIHFSLQQLFRHQTIYDLVQVLGAEVQSKLVAEPVQPFSLISPQDRLRLPSDAEDAYPLTMLQAGMFFHSQYSPDSAVYHDIGSYHLQVPFNRELLHMVIQHLAACHPIMRTAFDFLDLSEPLQLVYQAVEIPLQVTDLSGFPPAEQDEMLAAWLEEDKSHPFDWARAPLLRFQIHLRSEKTFQFTLTCHHAILDGWSVAVLFTELFTAYLSLLRGDHASFKLSKPAMQFRDFVALERKLREVEEAKQYWIEKLRDCTSALLPRWTSPKGMGSRPTGYSDNASSVYALQVPISQEVSSRLKRLAQEIAVPLKSVLLAAHLRVMSVLHGQTDVLTGLVSNGRPETTDGERALGLFLNTVPLRMKLSGGTWIELIRETFAAECELLPHRWYPLAEIQKQQGRQALFETIFNFVHFHVFQNVLNARKDPDEFQLLGINGFEKTNFTLGATFFLDLLSSQIHLSLRCNTSGTDPEAPLDLEQIEAIGGYYVQVLASLTDEPQGRYELQSPLSAREQAQLLVEWNATRTDYPQEFCLHHLIEKQVERTPDAIAVTQGAATSSSEQIALTYEELNRRANHLAHHLQTLGVGPEVCVGLFLERSLELIVALLAVLKAGGAYVPLEPTYPAERLTWMLQEVQPPVVLTQTHLMPQVEQSFRLQHAQCIDVQSHWESAELDTNPVSTVRPENLLYIIYTSGSTGKPKGVMNTHRGLCNRLVWMQQTYQLNAADRALQKTPFSFDVSVWEFFWPLLTGASLVIARPGGHQDPAYLKTLIIEEQVTTIHFVPSMLSVFLEESNLQTCTSLRQVMCSGEVLMAELQERFFTEFALVQLHNLYGPTEAAIGVTYWQCRQETDHLGKSDDYRRVPIGRPIANTQIYLLDRSLQPVPIGVMGELFISGEGLARGYFKGSEQTAEKFIANPFDGVNAGSRLYRTGDLARYRVDGAIEYLGRTDSQVKLRGYRIELGEIEANLRACPGVQEAVVVLREDNETKKYLVAYVVRTKDFPTEMAALQEYLHERLPDYMVPTHFVFLERLPITTNGKIDRGALPAPANLLSEQYVRFVGLRTPLEELLAQIWAQVLGCSQVGIYENFFQLGGHSLLATQVVSRIRQAVQVEVPLRTLFEVPTIAQFSLHLGDLMRGAPSAYVSPIGQTHGVEPRDLPLSFAQQRLWFLDQLEPGSTAYLSPRALHFQGYLQARAIEQSLQALVHRHEILRTTFVGTGQVNSLEYPVQVIHPAGKYLLPIIDLQGLRLEHGEEEAQRLAREEAQYPCDLEEGPLQRTYLLRLERQVHILLLTQHHIITDGWSIQVLMHELSILYQACVVGQAAPLAPLPIQYADYALWQRQWLQGDVLEEQMAYWRRQLADLVPLELPTDHLRPAVKTDRGASQSWLLPKAVLDELLDLCRKQDVTLFMLLLAAFQVLLMRYSGQTDMSVGSPIANRTRAEFEGLIGFFANTLVLRTDLGGNPTFEQLLRRVREVCLGAYVHQDIPFEKVVEVLAPERDISRTPLFQVMLVLQNIPGEAGRDMVQTVRDLGGVSVTPLPIGESTTSKFDLTLSVTQTEQGLEGALEYSTDLFEAESITRLLGNFQTLLRSIVDDPQANVADLPLLTQEERQQLLVEWNVPLGMNVSASERVGYAGEASSPTDKPSPVSPTSPPSFCVHELFEQQGGRTPDAVALVLADEVLTYGELNCRANQLAHYLQRLGVGPEVLVGISLQRSLEMIIGLLAVFKAGGAYVPLDADYPAARLAFMMQETRIALLLTQKRLERQWSAACACVVVLEQVWEQLLCESEQNLESTVGLESLAYILYTSGSTGLPKGVQISHRGLCNVMLAHTDMFGLGVGSRILQYASLNFDVSVLEIFVALLAGGSLHLTLERPLGADLWQMLEQQALTWIAISPSVLAGLPEREPLPALQTLVVGGEVCPVGVMRRWSKGRRFVNEYGCTEATVCTSLVEYGMDMPVGEGSDLVPLAANLEGSLLCLGRPLVNTQMYLLDGNLQPVPVGVIGEICLGGVGLARGYLGRADLTAERFVPHPFVGTVPDCSAGARLYRTGDLARYRGDGSIEFLGRRDLQVQVRSIRIELGEIEATLQAHPGVREAVVVLREEGEARKYLVAYVTPLVPQAEESPTTRGGELALTLQRYLRGQLPDAMVPTHVVVMETLPLTPNGKVDRVAIGLAPMVPVVGERKNSQGVRQMALYTPLQELLACIWEDVLHLQEIGIHESFFELGGHSLLATQVVSRIRQAMQVELPLRALFEAPTIAQLSLRLEEFMGGAPGRSEAWAPLQPMERPSDLPLSFAQERLWFLDQWNKGSAWYSVPMALRLSGSLKVAVLESSLATVVQRHEALRTSFEDRSGSPVQVIAQTLPIRIPVIDLSNWGGIACDLQVSQLARAEAERSFDLACGPLLRVCLLRLDEQEHVLLFTLHHIVGDGWSMDVLVREITALYQAQIDGEPIGEAQGTVPTLPDLPIQYADYALWQRQWLQGDVLEEQMAYWRRQLADLVPLELPTDHQRPAVGTDRGASQSCLLPAVLSRELLGLCRKQDVTLFMLLLAAFQVLLMRYTGQTDISVGSPIANRTRAEFEGLIGFFVNTLVLRTDLGGSPTFEQLLRRVREVCLGAYIHQDIPFEKVVEMLTPERDISRTPLFQVMLVLLNTPGETGRGMVQTVRDLGGVSVTPLWPSEGSPTSKFDLTLSVNQIEQGLACVLEYSTDLFEAESITRLLGNFQTLLQSIVDNPQAKVADLPLLTEEERRQLLVEWNVPLGLVSPPLLCVHELFEQQGGHTPDAVALVFGDEVLTYGELNRRANQLAHYLQGLGVGPEVLVGISLQRSLEMIIGLLAVFKAGGAYVPLDADYPEARLAFMMQETRIALLLTRKRLERQWSAACTCVVVLEQVWEQLLYESEQNLVSTVGLENLAYIIYTSGSTGLPKGVQVSHRGLGNVVLAHTDMFGLGAGSRVLQYAALSFDVSVLEIFMALLVGGSLHLSLGIPPGPDLLQVLDEQAITCMMVVSSVLAALPESESLPTLQTLVVGGEVCPVGLMRRWAKGRRFFNAYGSTEATICTSLVEYIPEGEGRELVPVAANLERSSLSLGRPLVNTQMYLLDGSLQPVSVGVVGEICLGGVGVARGYLGRADLTAERFVPHPFVGTVPDCSAGARLYRTGDLARYRSDGSIEFLGRRDLQVKVRGYRIELGEIEAQLQRHPAIQHCVMLAREDAPGEKRLVAYLVLQEGVPMGTVHSLLGDIRGYLQDHLPAYMIPLVFIPLDALPLKPNGKLDRQVLSTLEESNRLSLVNDAQASQSVQPRDAIELQLVQIWEEVLQIQPVSVLADFFAIGGHSLLAVRLMSRIAQHFGHRLNLATIFQHSTVAELAVILRQQITSDERSPVVALQSQGSRPPFFCVHPAGGTAFCYVNLARYLGPDQPFYGLHAPDRSRCEGVAGHGTLSTDWTTVEEMAAAYVAAIQKVQPQGPYLLGGWSLGGIIAFEMACQLQQQGEEVGLLAVIDSRFPNEQMRAQAGQKEIDLGDGSMARELINLVGVTVPDDFDQREPHEQFSYAVEQTKKMHVFPVDTSPEFVRHFVRTSLLNQHMMSVYVPQRYQHRIDYFVATASLEEMNSLGAREDSVGSREASPVLQQQDQLQHWRKLASNIEVHLVPGNHQDMILQDANVRELAHALSGCIDRVSVDAKV